MYIKLARRRSIGLTVRARAYYAMRIIWQIINACIWCSRRKACELMLRALPCDKIDDNAHHAICARRHRQLMRITRRAFSPAHLCSICMPRVLFVVLCAPAKMPLRSRSQDFAQKSISVPDIIPHNKNEFKICASIRRKYLSYFFRLRKRSLIQI